MTNFTRFVNAAAICLALGATSAHAQSGVDVLKVDLASGAESWSMALDDISKITVTENGFCFHSNSDAAAVKEFTFDEMARVYFSLESTSGIESNAMADCKTSVFPSPATDVINVAGASIDQPCAAEIYSVSGQLVTRVANWKGEAIDVANLNQGLYILRINNSSIKFSKL